MITFTKLTTIFKILFCDRYFCVTQTDLKDKLGSTSVHSNLTTEKRILIVDPEIQRIINIHTGMKQTNTQ